MLILPPSATEDFGFYNRYIRKVTETDLLKALKETQHRTLALISGLSEAQLCYRYAPGKWCIKEILQHLIDVERSFDYRAMRFARGDRQALPPYDINEYVIASKAIHRALADLVEEAVQLRKTTVLLFKSFSEQMLDQTGPARDTELSVRAIGYNIIGHEMHHAEWMQEKYLAAFIHRSE